LAQPGKQPGTDPNLIATIIERYWNNAHTAKIGVSGAAAKLRIVLASTPGER